MKHQNSIQWAKRSLVALFLLACLHQPWPRMLEIALR
jgi:hypothetical protein